jgi:hypothetical protein
LLAVSNRFYLISNEYGGRLLFHAWVIIEVLAASDSFAAEALRLAKRHQAALTAAGPQFGVGSQYMPDSVNARQSNLGASLSIVSPRIEGGGGGVEGRALKKFSDGSGGAAAAGGADDGPSEAFTTQVTNVIAMLHTLWRSYIPSADVVHSSAQRVLQTLSALHPELYVHIRRVYTTSNAMEAYDTRGAGGLIFPVQAPILIERWLDHSFAGFLQPAGVMYIWDQCFFWGWHILSHFATQLVLLLEKDILDATTVGQLDHIFAFSTRRVPTKALVERFQDHVIPEL